MLIKGVYAITDGSPLPVLKDKVAAALRGGISVLQYRDKSGDTGKRLQEAQVLRELCSVAGVPLIINDDAALAASVEADGVHLGRDDGELASAREALGAKAIIGISCYNEVERAVDAARAGADYVAFGRFFASRSKPGAVQAELHQLDEARGRIDLPIVTIGGITAANAAPLIQHGADMIAIIDGLFGSPDIAASASELNQLFKALPT